MRRYQRSPGLALEQCRLLVDFGKRKGLNAESCLENTDIDEAMFNETTYEPSTTQELQIIQNLTRLISEPADRLGYEAGHHSKLHHYGLIGQAMLSSNNLLHALNIALRYCQEVFHFTSFTSSNQGKTLSISWLPHKNDILGVEQFLVARDLGTGLSIIEQVTGKRPKGILAARTFFTDEQLILELKEKLDCTLEPMSNGAELVLNSDNLLQPMPQRNPQTCQILEQFCYEQLHLPEDLPLKDSFTEQVAYQLRKSKFRLSRDDVAKQLNISSRTLARYLLNEKTTWRELIANIRIDHAKQLLTSSKLPIEIVAEDVGFGSSSAFSLAFRRAAGMTPREFRKQFTSAKTIPTQITKTKSSGL